MSAYDIRFAPELELAQLTDAEVRAIPLLRFRRHFEQAQERGVDKPNAACLATADAKGRPSARIVLVKEVHPNGVVFYTNFQSRKGCEIQANPCAEIAFYWSPLEIQIRLNGPVQKISREQSAQYFRSRPRASQLGATISPQSQSIQNRQELEAQYDDLATQLRGQPIPLPDHWGGYLLLAEQIEFWYGQAGRLHDRFEYKLIDGQWHIRCLAP